MGRPPRKKGGVTDHPLLWNAEHIPEIRPKLPDKNFRGVRYPLWTANKARLIEEYLRLFEYITHHGTYIDGFAAPQSRGHLDAWAAKLVLEMEPKWFRDFWLCDIDPKGVAQLNELKTLHASSKRRVDVLAGDFNKTVRKIFEAGRIKEKTATFALLDQRTFECEWETVVALSKHKSGTKIEIFYFFPTGWIDRSIGAVRAEKTKAKVNRWWGRDDWLSLRGMDSVARAILVAQRFEKELGYGKVKVYPIHSEVTGQKAAPAVFKGPTTPALMR
jgi:three-Cys-motif partner protein